jgi:hypothetical protein
MNFSAITAAACVALLATVLGLWLRPALWMAGLIVTVVLGYMAGVLYGPAAVWIALLAVSVWGWHRSRSLADGWKKVVLRGGLALLAMSITVLLGMHALPGFRNPLLVKDLVIAAGAAPYTLYFNFDKTIAGILLIGTASASLLRTAHEWNLALRRAAPIIAINVTAAMLLSLALGYVEFQPKWTAFFWTWAVVNLLLTCLSEEAFFRGFVQRELEEGLRHRRLGGVIAVAASALLFGLAHFAGGWRYVLLATVAGAGYAIVYQQTRRIEMSILAHFTLNAVHFLLFTYPQVG